jgi:hypothetical protein
VSGDGSHEPPERAGGVTGETVTAMIVKGLIARDAAGHLALTSGGRAALRALPPDDL